MSSVSREQGLRLMAQDEEDVAVLSSALQDSILRMRDVSYDPRARRFTAVVSRFRWESAKGQGPYQRIRAALSVDGVEAVRSRKVRLDAPDSLAYLLAMRFESGAEPPAGQMRLVLAGGGEIALECECVDALLVDFGEPWLTRRRPQHEAGQDA